MGKSTDNNIVKEGREITMATPIKDTPVLSGKDSERFLKDIKANEKKKVSRNDYNRAVRTYNKLMKNAKL